MTGSTISILSPAMSAYAADVSSVAHSSEIRLAQLPTSEEMRHIASRLVMSLAPAEQIVACSGIACDDPSGSFAAHAGLALVRLGYSPVLVVDAVFPQRATDLSPPRRAVGLSNVLANEVNFAAAVIPTDVDGLQMMAAGNPDVFKPSQLSSDAIKIVLEGFRTHRFVLLNVGSVTGSADGMMLASIADALVLVAAKGERTKREVLRAQTELTLLKSRFLGLVLTDVR
jgi:Mrp family chromosome partitioning ATPase